MRGRRTQASGLALVVALGWSSALHAVDYVVPAGQTDSTPKTLSGNDTLTVDQGGTLTSSTPQTVAQAGPASGVVILNRGRIDNSADAGRAINTTGAAGDRTISISNEAGGVITSAEDAIRIGNNLGAGTLSIVNAGTINATGPGQALDLDAVNTSTANSTITNLAGGVIRSTNEDAVRTGLSTLNNSGQIFADGPAGTEADGVAAQSRNAIINNLGGGQISGLRNGVAANGSVTVNNSAGATIAGRTNAGIGTNGGTATISNAGRVAGAVDGISGGTINLSNLAGGQIGGQTGAGVTGTGTVTVQNAGAISGGTVGVRGNNVNISNDGGSISGTNGAGILGANNGTIVNSGLISGAATGGNADGDGINLAGNATVSNSGTIQGTGASGVDANGQANSAAGIAAGGGRIENAVGATIVGAGNGIVIGANGDTNTTTITNLGTIRGQAGAAIVLTGTRNDIVENAGAIIGGNGLAVSFGGGNDTFRLQTNSTVIGGLDGGEGNDTITVSGAPGTGGTLTGAVNFEVLNVQGGVLATTGIQNFTTITVSNGARLENRGTLGGQTNVTAGDIVGTGTFQALSVVGAGSAIRPGDGAIGTITVTGDYVQRNGAIYFADLNPAGASDRIVVGGTATLSGSPVLAVTKAAGTYVPGTRYTLLTAAGGLTGTFGTIATDNDPLTQIRVTYGANAVVLDILRSAAGLNAAATTPNQRAVAGGLAGADVNSPLFSVVGGVADTPTLTRLLDQLSGEVHAAAHLGMLADARRATDAVATRFESASVRSGAWLQALGGTGSTRGRAGAAKVERDGYGLIGGVDAAAFDGMRGGVAIGYNRGKVDVGARGSRADTDTIHGFLYGGGVLDRVSFRLEAGFSRVDVKTRRTVALPGAGENPRASYRGGVVSVAGEIGYTFPLGTATLLPFVAGQSFRVDHNGFTETGGLSALTVTSTNDNFTYALGGVRVYSAPDATLGYRASVAWRHLFGNRDARVTANFGGAAATGFTVLAAPSSREEAVAQADVLWRVAERVRVGVGYSGVIGNRGQDHAARLTASIGL